MKQLVFSLMMIFISIGTAQDAKPVKVIHFKELQKFLPAKAPEGFTREKPKGQTVTSSGVSTSNATVTFTAQKTERQTETMDDGTIDSVDADITWTVTIDINDYAGLGDAMAASLQMISSMEYENETDDGYDKSTSFNGYKGIEKSNAHGYDRSCELQLVVGNRFLVNATGSGFADVSVLQSLLYSMDLKKLEALK
jgi:hypothetical protein